MNSRWQANKIGLINFWYYDEQEFPFVKGRMLLRGSNGSGKSVTMQSIVPLLLDGNMSPERLDPFGSRDRKMSSYLLEENDDREERTGYLYLEFKRKESEIYLTVGMGIRARKGKPLDKWYFSITDGRRIGKDFFLYKNIGEKVTLSKRELENRITEGGRIFDKQSEYMEYVNKQIFGFETIEEYKEMLDLLIQLRTPKLSKDFKPTVINDILSDSLQPLSDDDLRPMAEAIENMDNMTMNLKSRKEAHQAAEKINAELDKYNRFMLFDKAKEFVFAKEELISARKELKIYTERRDECNQNVIKLEEERQELIRTHDIREKEKDELNRSDVVALKKREVELSEEIEEYTNEIKKKETSLSEKEVQFSELQSRLRESETKKYKNEKLINELVENMESDADDMAFQEFEFMKSELKENLEQAYEFDIHKKDFLTAKERIFSCEQILEEIQQINKDKETLEIKKDQKTRELDSVQRKILEVQLISDQAKSEWKENLYKWNERNEYLNFDSEVLRELALFADSYNDKSDFAEVKEKVHNRKIEVRNEFSTLLDLKYRNIKEKNLELEDIRKELEEWENQKEPVPMRPEAVTRNRQRLKELGIPYHEFYKVIEFSEDLDEDSCNRLEEALMKMGILDAVVVEEQYREKVLEPVKGCEDRYLFASDSACGKSLLGVLELNDEVNDIFSNQRLSGILDSISYNDESVMSVAENGTYSMGVISGTVTGEYEAGFLGTRARERNRQLQIRECQSRIALLQQEIAELKMQANVLEEKMMKLDNEYSNLPDDIDMREALRLSITEERNLEVLQKEYQEVSERLEEVIEQIKVKRNAAIEIAKKLYLDCTYDVFRRAKNAADSYEKALIRLEATHKNLLENVASLLQQNDMLETVDADMDEIRYDINKSDRRLKKKRAERTSVQEQLELTDYDEIREKLDACISWLNYYPQKLQDCVARKTQNEEEAKAIGEKIQSIGTKIKSCEACKDFFSECFEEERKLGYVEIPEEVKDAEGIYRYLLSAVKDLEKADLAKRLYEIYTLNKAALSEYKLIQVERFSELKCDSLESEYSPKRDDIVAKYQGVEMTFSGLIRHLEGEIEELESLIKAGDRELFEDILSNTISRKIRGKIHSSDMWVKKMNALMSSMDTSSGLKLSLKWRSKTAEQENQLDTRDLVELLKKDYRLMNENEAERLSEHFKSKVEMARRIANDDGGMISFYQIMKETLDYRKWFEFQLMSQKTGERQKELTNSVFGTFSGGEKAMSMYVPLFSAVVAKYQGGREDAPRLISLDEAFAGVDNRNIRDMFRLMAQFEFDFIINSQVLWGDCDTLDALAIYQLERPENAKFVTVMPFLWNGFRKELLDSEEDVEERGTEIGQLS